MDIKRTLITWSNSLSGRVLISTLLIHIILLIVLFYSVINLVENNYKDQFINDVRTDSHRITQLVIYELLNHDNYQLNVFAENLLFGSQLVLIIIKDPDGKVIYSSENNRLDSNYISEDFFFGGNGDDVYLIKNQLVSKGGIKLGTLKLAYDEISTVDEINRLYRSVIIIVSIYMFIIIVATGAIDTYLTQPLRKITMDSNRIVSGKYDEHFSTHSDINEVRILAESLELMRSELVSRGGKLADGKKRISILLDNIVDAVIVCDQQGNIESVNQAITSITNYKVEELLQKNVSSLINFEEALRNFKSVPSIRVYESVALSAAIKKIPVEVNMSEFQQSNKSLILILLRDISERKRSEIERFKYHNDMAHAGRLGIMGEMAAGMAHELNQPLAAMSLYLQGSLRLCNPNHKVCKDIIVAVKSAITQVDRASAIIRKMRGFARRETHVYENVDINNLIKKSIDLVLIGQQNVSPIPDLLLTNSQLIVKVDALQIEQVLVNLIKNAFDAQQHLEDSKRYLQIKSEIDEKGFIKVVVSDAGEGVIKENIDKVFDTYFTTKADGLGMGLSISRSIIEKHDGSLWYVSGSGQTYEHDEMHELKRNAGNSGSQFCFTLPAALV